MEVGKFWEGGHPPETNEKERQQIEDEKQKVIPKTQKIKKGRVEKKKKNIEKERSTKKQIEFMKTWLKEDRTKEEVKKISTSKKEEMKPQKEGQEKKATREKETSKKKENQPKEVKQVKTEEGRKKEREELEEITKKITGISKLGCNSQNNTVSLRISRVQEMKAKFERGGNVGLEGRIQL